MRILGIDPGSRVCGYGIIVAGPDRLTYVECGVLTAPEDRPAEQRLGAAMALLGLNYGNLSDVAGHA